MKRFVLVDMHSLYSPIFPLIQIPAILSEELCYSPYLLTGLPSVRSLLGLSQQTSEEKVLATLRQRKDTFIPYT